MRPIQTPTLAIALLSAIILTVQAQTPDPLNEETCTPDSITIPPAPPVTPGGSVPLSPICVPAILPGSAESCSTSSCEVVRIDDDPPVNNRLDTQAAANAAPGTLYWGNAKVWTQGNDGSGSGLDADFLDGLSSESFLGATAKAADSDKLDGQDSTAFLGVAAKAADSDRLDGLDSAAFLTTTGKAADSDKLDGFYSAAFLAATAKAADSDKLDGLDAMAFLGATATAANADKLDNLDSTAFLPVAGKAADADKLDGSDGTAFAKTAESGLRIVRGSVGAAGSINAGSGFSIVWTPCGSYTFTFSTAFSGQPTMVLSSSAANPSFRSVTSLSASGGHVQTWNQAGNCDSLGFDFIAIGPA